jgi:hypothetical protein
MHIQYLRMTSVKVASEFDFELKVPVELHTGAKGIQVKFNYRPGEAHGFNVITRVDAHEPYTAFLPLASVRESPPLSPGDFRAYVTKLIPEDHITVEAKADETSDSLLLIFPASGFLPEIQTTLVRPLVDRTTLLSRELALANKTISELRYEINDLKSQVERPGPSFRYGILSGEIYLRHSDEDPIPDFLFNFIREAGVVKRICDEYAKVKLSLIHI